jgi:hypothetical protein
MPSAAPPKRGRLAATAAAETARHRAWSHSLVSRSPARRPASTSTYSSLLGSCSHGRAAQHFLKTPLSGRPCRHSGSAWPRGTTPRRCEASYIH